MTANRDATGVKVRYEASCAGTDVEVVIHRLRGQDPVDVFLTPEEARDFARRLLKAAEQATRGP